MSTSRSSCTAPAARSSTQRARPRPPSVALRLLAAEAAAHARGLHHHPVARHVEHVRHHRLHLRRVLRRGRHEHLAVLAALGQGGVGLEVEVLLRRRCEIVPSSTRSQARQRRVPVAPPDGQGLGVVAVLRDRRSIESMRRQRLVLTATTARAARAQPPSVSPTTQATAWPWIEHLARRRAAARRAGRGRVVLAGHVRRRQHRHRTRGVACAARVQVEQTGPGVRATAPARPRGSRARAPRRDRRCRWPGRRCAREQPRGRSPGRRCRSRSRSRYGRLLVEALQQIPDQRPPVAGAAARVGDGREGPFQRRLRCRQGGPVPGPPFRAPLRPGWPAPGWRRRRRRPGGPGARARRRPGPDSTRPPPCWCPPGCVWRPCTPGSGAFRRRGGGGAARPRAARPAGAPSAGRR